MEITEIPVRELQSRLGFPLSIDYPGSSLNKPLTEWKMGIDDAPTLRYIYRSFRPQRHLEFGTWEGEGCCYCLEECDASVWTINLLEGELKSDGSWAYSSRLERNEAPITWANTQVFGDDLNQVVWYQTDALGFIGRQYRARGFGHRVCQIYCDSRQWDISNYSPGFFDTVLIDGGHSKEIVSNDTHKAMKLLRSGGIILWHDFCPNNEVYNARASTRGPQDFITSNWDWIASHLKDAFWINPSWLLLGIVK